MPGWKYAFSLSRDAVGAATPPGTVHLIEHGITQQNGRYIDRLAKYPVPTSDPADPLNWTPWMKNSCLVAVAFYAFVCNFISESIVPALSIWSISFPHDPRPLDSLALFVSLNVLALGLGGIFWVPLANVFGRRPVLVVSALILFIATACGTAADSFGQVLAIRVLQGLGGSASETLAVVTVGDMFFVHERGIRMAFYMVCLIGGSAIGGLCGGYIAAQHGWFAIFGVNAVLSGVAFLGAMLLAPETTYERDSPCLPIRRNLPRVSRYFPRTPAPYLSLGSLPSMRITIPSRLMESVRADPVSPELTWYHTTSSPAAPSSVPTPARQSKQPSVSHGTIIPTLRYPPFTYWRSLTFGMYRDNVSYCFAKPWTTLLLPATWIVMLQYASLFGSMAIVSSLGQLILSVPPYSWGEDSGLMFVGALVGSLLGGLYTALCADYRLKLLARKQDHGFAEPESRVPIMLPSLAVATGGLLVFGFCAEYSGGLQWIGLEFAFGMVAFALTQVASVWFCYLIDSYNQLASDCFAMIGIMRGVVPFAVNFWVSKWLEKDGYLVPFGSFTVIMAVCSLLMVPLIWAGKRMRIATARYVVGNQ